MDMPTWMAIVRVLTNISELLNAYRVVPRVLVLCYGVVCWNTWAWFTDLPDPTTTQMTFASTIWGAAAIWFNFYVSSGGKR